PGRRARRVGAHRAALVPSGNASHPCRDPAEARPRADTAAAEESLLAAIAIAQSQKARSFELRAALARAKLYRAASRAADAHAVLAPLIHLVVQCVGINPFSVALRYNG